MKKYNELPETATWRETFDNINNINKNLTDEDFLYKSYLGDGQLFNVAHNVGYVNGQEAYRFKNITITPDYIANFKIAGFQFYHRKSNTVIDVNIDCNLYNYRDNKVHFLYLVLSQHGKYEVHDTMFDNTEDLVLFARFVINTDGNATQFYVIAPFAGSPDYIKGNQNYEVSEGFDLVYYNKNTKQFTIPQSKVRFSGVNFDDYASPDVLHVVPENTNIKFKYIYWDTVDRLPRVNWTANNAVNNLDTTKTMNYTSGAVSTVNDGYFTNQKIYYDLYTKTFIAMYGVKAHPTMEEAVMEMDEILSYPKPDGFDYLIPIAVVILKNTTAAYDEDNIRIIGLKYDEHELFDTNDVARQQSLEAIRKAENAINIANTAVSDMTVHAGNKSNPHNVTKNQIGLDKIENYGIATKAEAELGTINTKYMTPLRTVEAITAKSIITDGNIILKISTTKPAAQSGKTIIWINPSS